jgi:hypothetical protein
MNHDPDRIDMNDGRDERGRGLERLPRRRMPERDLWPGIESRLQPHRRSPTAALRAAVRHYPLAEMALAASLVAGLAIMFTLGLRDSALPATGLDVAAEPRYLTDDSRAIVQANLSLVEQAERELRKAIRQDPESTTLRSLLQSAEQRQLTLRAML